MTPVAIAGLALATLAEVFRLSFFADDFHFLDVARRVPLLEALGGQYGIYPWYRPLSRELFFELVAATGPARAFVAHAAGVLGVFGCAWLLFRIGAALVGPPVGAIGVILFTTYEFTKFLAAWPSGFQDVLAMLLTLLALDAAVARRHGRAVLWATLAPFAKETALVAAPLVLLHAVLVAGERRPRRWMLGLAAGVTIVVAVHVAVRLGWRTGGSTATIERSPGELIGALGEILRGFAGSSPMLEPAGLVLALFAGIAALALVAAARGAAPDAARRRAGAWFLAIAALLGVAPILAGQLLQVARPQAYYGFPAAPWLALLLGLGLARLPRGSGAAVAVGLAAWNVLALAWQPPSPTALATWTFRRWDWREAARLSWISERLAANVRAVLSERPDSLVVLVSELPYGCFFQTGDGPALRVSLGDPTVRAFYLNQTPYEPVDPGRIRILEFEPATQLLAPMSPEGQIDKAATALAEGAAGKAWALAAHGSPELRERFDMRYYRAVAALIAGDTATWKRELGDAGLLDPGSDVPARVARNAVPPDLVPAMEATLRSPLEAEPHARFGRILLERDVIVSAAFELRVAFALDSTRAEFRPLLAEAVRRVEAAKASLEGGAPPPLR